MHSKSFKQTSKHHNENISNISYIKNNKKKLSVGISNLEFRDIQPLTDNQRIMFSHYSNTDKHLVLSGFPGTGKTFLTLYLALRDIYYGNNNYYKIIILRSLLTSRSVGFLPGSLDEKQEPFFTPYHEMCHEIFGRGDASEILLKKDILQFENTSYLRGITFNNSIIIVDEFQNENFNNLSTIITRVSDSSRIIFCGDFAQTDLIYQKNDTSGFSDFMKIISNMNEFKIIDFEIDDIVRGEMVKNFIIEKYKLGL